MNFEQVDFGVKIYIECELIDGKKFWALMSISDIYLNNLCKTMFIHIVSIDLLAW